jgi:hypothetical protein
MEGWYSRLASRSKLTQRTRGSNKVSLPLEEAEMLEDVKSQECDSASAPETSMPKISGDPCNGNGQVAGTTSAVAELDSHRSNDADETPLITQDDECIEMASLPKHFSWMDSACRQTVVEFGKLVHVHRVEQQLTEQRALEAALATAQAASKRTGKEDFSVGTKEHSSDSNVHDVNAWMAQERAFIAETLRAVTHNVQKRARRSSGLTSFSGGSAEADDSWTWGFLLPKSTKLKPEAAAEMARARVAAAAAAKAMLGDDAEVFQGSGRSCSPGSSYPTAEVSGRHRQRPISEPPLHRSPLDMRSGGGTVDRRSTDGGGLPYFDDTTMMHRAQLQNASPLTSLDSLIGNPGFPRALSEESTRQASRKAPLKKKRVSFGVSTVCDE